MGGFSIEWRRRPFSSETTGGTWIDATSFGRRCSRERRWRWRPVRRRQLTHASTCCSTSRSRASIPTSTVTSSNTSAAWCTTASGSASSRASRTPRACDRRSWITCAGSRRATSGGPAGASPTATTGGTASAPARAGRAAPISGPTAWARGPMGPGSTTRTSSARTSSYDLRGSVRPSPIWPPTCGASRRATSISGSSTATLPRDRRRSPSCGPAGGDPDPLRVRFWGVGNETWGCGGNLTAEEYAVEYRQFTAWVPRFGQELSFIGSGPNGGDLGLDTRFLPQPHRERRERPGQHVGLGAAPLFVERESRRNDGLGRRQGSTRSSTRPTSGTRCSRKPT